LQFEIGLPSLIPSLQLGLQGAITPLKSPPPSLKSMFDFSIAGPIAGMMTSLAFLVAGLSMTASANMDQIANLPGLPVYLLQSSALGGGLTEMFLGKGVLGQGVSADSILQLHPFAISGFVGLMANAIALLPLGRKCNPAASMVIELSHFSMGPFSSRVCTYDACIEVSFFLTVCVPPLSFVETDGGRVALTMFGRRGAFVVKSFAGLLLCFAGLIGFDGANIILSYVLFAVLFQRELETPARNEVEELDFVRGALGICMALVVALALFPMQ
jgi:hypothetical protein